jgi:hypothetical protein
MERSEFWSLIDKARRKAGGDGEEAGEIVAELLSKRSQQEIRDFAGHLNDCMRRSYTPAMWEACSLMMGADGDLSGDLFEYFRAWLVMRGERTYSAVVTDPDALAGIEVDDPIEECWVESLLSAPDEALGAVAGMAADDEGIVELDITRGPPAGEWTGPVEKVMPRLWAKYGERLEL